MRADHDLAFLLRFENIAWFEDGAVRILDRRCYPSEERFVTCTTYGEVADAIRSMVTQSYGPFHAACMGMVLAAHECRDLTAAEQRAFLSAAATAIATARPTTERKMRAWTDGCEAAANAAIDAGESARDAVFCWSKEQFTRRYERFAAMGRHFAARIPKGGAVLTQCYADAAIGLTARALIEADKGDVRFFCPETRPYLQGSRLTASVLCDMGFSTTLITDNMPAYTMQTKHIDVFTSASDVITMDGHIVNKVGTFGIAIAAKELGVPYYCTGFPNREHPTVDTVRIEERDPEEVTHAMGRRTCKAAVRGYYPAFDITPPRFVTGIVTDRGIFRPGELKQYAFETETGNV